MLKETTVCRMRQVGTPFTLHPVSDIVDPLGT
jgi:hypothetical protein